MVAGVKIPGDAKFFAHPNAEAPGRYHLVVHAVGSDFRKPAHGLDGVPLDGGAAAWTREAAAASLARCYANILREFLRSGHGALRLVPMSGGIFSGEFGPVIPSLTHEALRGGLAHLTQAELALAASKELEMCVFLEKELPAFREAGFTTEPARALDFVRGIPLRSYGVLGQRLSAAGDLLEVAPFPSAIPGCIFIDPASLHHIKPPGKPGNAGGASGAIYEAIGIAGDAAFPDDVVAKIQEVRLR